MKAGPLNRRIRIERRQTGTDSIGQPLDGWELVGEVWAWVQGGTGMASIRQSGLQDNVAASLNSYSFRVRFREGLDAGMRVFYGGQAFDVKQVRMDFAGREWTDLVCETGGNQG